METLWIKGDNLEKAIQFLEEGEVVAFPTETVYGLGADASKDEAVRKIYKAKGRPSDNPLIVHIHSKDQVREFTDDIPQKALQLMDAFWPGPLTIILKHTLGKASKSVTAGLNSIGLRIPSHPVALRLLKESNIPLAAPSANVSGKPSPTSAEHVWHDLNGQISALIDGGETGVGIESTVIDITDESHPTILRPGGISKEEIESIIGFVDVNSEYTQQSDSPKAPGMKYRHYSPDKPVVIVNDDWQSSVSKLLKSDEKIGILASDKILKKFAQETHGVFSLGKENDVTVASQLLYKGLRYFDDSDVSIILVQAFPKDGIGAAYMNRLEKAAGEK